MSLLAAALALWGGQVMAQDTVTPPAPSGDAVSPSDPVEAPDAVEAPEAEEPARISIEAEDVDRIRVDADSFEAYQDPDGSRIVTAAGNVRATVTRQPEPGGATQTAVILADTMTANMDSRVLRAQGNVVLSSEGRTATGDTLVYRWQEGAAHVEGVSFREYGISFRAGRMDVRPNRLLVTDAAFSTCGLENPDFVIAADRVTIIPDQRIEARGVTVELFRRRILRLSRLVYRLERGRATARQALPVGRPGYSRVSGFSLAQPIPIGLNLDAEIEATTRAGLRGRALYERVGNAFSPFAEVSWKQEVAVRDRRAVLVSRLPVVGLHFGPNKSGEISAGSFREHSTGAHEERLHMSYNHVIIDRGTRPGVVLRAGGLASLYANGDQYRAVYGEVAVGRGGEDTFEEIGLRVNDISGDSPFLWDRVQVRNEVFGAKRIAWGDYRLEGAVRYDMDRSNFYDVQLAVGRRFSCLEPELRFSTRSQSISVGLKVFGIGSTAND